MLLAPLSITLTYDVSGSRFRWEGIISWFRTSWDQQKMREMQNVEDKFSRVQFHCQLWSSLIPRQPLNYLWG
ncbi:hypothetical protein SLA2020_065220 [Shorea laevis]